MVEVPIYNLNREEIGTISFSEDALGGLTDGSVNGPLLKLAVVRHLANRRQGTVKTKNRALVEGSTRKLYRQKGTGNARRGMIRTPIMKGGGHAFGKDPRDFNQVMPKQARRLATRQAVLSKFLDKEVVVVGELKADAPKTKWAADVLETLQVADTTLVAVPSPADDAGRKQHETLWKSVRNIEGVSLLPVSDLNAYDVLRSKTLLLTKDALVQFVGGDAKVKLK